MAGNYKECVNSKLLEQFNVDTIYVRFYSECGFWNLVFANAEVLK